MNTILERRAMLDTRSSWTTRVFACDEMALCARTYETRGLLALYVHTPAGRYSTVIRPAHRNVSI